MGRLHSSPLHHSVCVPWLCFLWSGLGGGCGTGEVYGVAPGPTPFIDSGTPVVTTDGGVGGQDAGIDAGPTGDAGEDCYFEEEQRRDLTPEEDLTAFVDTGVRAEFSCAICHRNKSPTGVNINWGASEDTDQGWFAAASALLERDGPVAPTETRLYASFSGTISSSHPADAVAQQAVVTWLEARSAGVTTPGERICVDAGPEEPPPVDEDPAEPSSPQDCTPVPPTQDESFTRFEELAVPTKLTGCAGCHAGSNKSATGAGTSWGASSSPPSPTDWHTAFYGKALAENLDSEVRASALYSHVTGSGVHFVAGAGDLVEQWLEYVVVGEPPAGCP